jgi:hypothetical protein
VSAVWSRARRVSCALLGSVLAGSPVRAGPPYVTDDPEPTDRGHWEDYLYADGAHAAGTFGGATGVDLNYGAAENLQLTLVLPLAFERGQSTHSGAGPVEVAAKYRVLRREDGRSPLDVALFPRVILPTASDRFGPARASWQLPVWVQGGSGPWSVFGGVAWQWSGDRDGRDGWLAGLAATRDLTPHLSLGAEVWHRSAESVDARSLTAMSLGLAWRFSAHWSLLASGGPGLRHARDEGQYTAYVALKADY